MKKIILLLSLFTLITCNVQAYSLSIKDKNLLDSFKPKIEKYILKNSADLLYKNIENKIVKLNENSKKYTILNELKNISMQYIPNLLFPLHSNSIYFGEDIGGSVFKLDNSNNLNLEELIGNINTKIHKDYCDRFGTDDMRTDEIDTTCSNKLNIVKTGNNYIEWNSDFIGEINKISFLLNGNLYIVENNDELDISKLKEYLKSPGDSFKIYGNKIIEVENQYYDKDNKKIEIDLNESEYEKTLNKINKIVGVIYLRDLDGDSRTKIGELTDKQINSDFLEGFIVLKYNGNDVFISKKFYSRGGACEKVYIHNLVKINLNDKKEKDILIGENNGVLGISEDSKFLVYIGENQNKHGGQINKITIENLLTGNKKDIDLIKGAISSYENIIFVDNEFIINSYKGGICDNEQSDKEQKFINIYKLDTNRLYYYMQN